MNRSGADNANAILVSQIGNEYARKLLDFAVARDFPTGAALIRDAEPIDVLYLVIDGDVSVAIESGGRSLSLGTLSRGSWLGEVTLLSGQALASSSVSAVSAVRLLEIKHSVFKTLLAEQADLANALLRVLVAGLAERIRASDAAIAQRDSNSFVLDPGAKPAEKEKTFIKSILQKLAGIKTGGAA